MIQLPKNGKKEKKHIFFRGTGGLSQATNSLAKIFWRVYWRDAVRGWDVAHTCESVISENKILIANVYGPHWMPI